MAINEEEEVYVVFSREQLLKNKKLYEKMGEVYPKTYVIINGKPCQYTDILLSLDNIVFTDTKILVKDKRCNLKLTER